jgi:hypothetical protein
MRSGSFQLRFRVDARLPSANSFTIEQKCRTPPPQAARGSASVLTRRSVLESSVGRCGEQNGVARDDQRVSRSVWAFHQIPRLARRADAKESIRQIGVRLMKFQVGAAMKAIGRRFGPSKPFQRPNAPGTCGTRGDAHAILHCGCQFVDVISRRRETGCSVVIPISTSAPQCHENSS